MFGTYRFILASLVVIYHLWPGPADQIGIYAVLSFYLLSGYLMTFVLNEQYGFSFSGISRFVLNRALRIYPAYLICFGLTILIIVIVPWLPFQMYYKIIVPSGIEWIKNASLIGLTGQMHSRVVPQAWSLWVEVVFYGLLALAFARKRYLVSLWFTGSVLYVVYVNLAGFDFYGRFMTIGSGSLPFSLGALAYYHRKELKSKGAFPIIFCAALYLENIFVGMMYDGWKYGGGAYLSLFIGFIILGCLKDVKSGGIDKLLGDLSYPMYVSHFLAGVAVLWAFFPGVPRHRGFDFFLLGFAYTLVISYAIDRYVQGPIESLRRKIRHGNTR